MFVFVKRQEYMSIKCRIKSLFDLSRSGHSNSFSRHKHLNLLLLFCEYVFLFLFFLFKVLEILDCFQSVFLTKRIPGTLSPAEAAQKGFSYGENPLKSERRRKSR